MSQSIEAGISFEQFKEQLPDLDPQETREWMESLDEVCDRAGQQRSQYLLYKLLKRARMLDLGLPPTTQTRYINTISPEQEPEFPGDEQMERRIRRLIRWNAAVMVSRANRRFPGLGGHLSSYASSASLYEIGFHHFFRGKDETGRGDHIFFQGHAAPGIYARAFLEGRISESQLEHFRREVGGRGLPSYPHPRLMRGFWEYPTVSMGLGPLNAVYHARFNRYLAARGLCDTSAQRVWAFLGDGETDEPEALGALTLAAREGLDNLTFVVNCNLQRLDGPVRGNGKIIQELEAVFRGAGWRVIKVLWGREWDEILANDRQGLLVQKMMETLDGDWQRCTVETGAYLRENFFGPEPELLALVEHLRDDQLVRLRRGGHDYRKLYAAYKLATETSGQPTVILAHTVKGWTLGEGAEGRNITHQIKKLDLAEMRAFRDRLELPIEDSALEDPPFYHPGKDSPELQYMLERRRVLGGVMPTRSPVAVSLKPKDGTLFEEFHAGSGETQEASTTMVFARLLRRLMKDEDLGRHVVPIVPDEARTFGMDPLFSEFKIYSPLGQLYTPVDAEFLVSYKEGKQGQVLEEGITEAGAMASMTAAGTSHAAHGVGMVPFFILYSMFGFQRIADMLWAFADSRGRGFLLGATAGRTTLNGEGLQHQDGHSQIFAATNPACVAYDPAYAYELALIIEDGLRRMYSENEDIYYYITLYNENYLHPAMPNESVREGVLKGLYLVETAEPSERPRVQLFGSGTILREVLRARVLLAERFGVDAEVWSATSYGELRREALSVERWNRLHPAEPARASYIERCLAQVEGPVVAASDFISNYPDLVSRWVRGRMSILGCDGFGRSDTRDALRRFFEIDAEHIAAAALFALAREGTIAAETAQAGLEALGLDPEGPDPALV